MPKIFYPFDAQAFWMRVGLVTAFAGITVLAVAGIVFVNLDVPREISATILLPPLLVLMIWEIVLPMIVRQRAGDGLRIDETGLARARNGREEHWRWDEVSAFRLHSGWHPMSIFIGRGLSFRGLRPAGRSRLIALLNRLVFGGHNIAFGDNYLALSGELEERLNRYRNIATGEAPRPAGEPATPAPDLSLFVATDALDSGKRSRAAAILLGVALLGAAIMVGFIMLNENWIPESLESFESFVKSEKILIVLIPLFFMTMQNLAQHFWQMSPASNLILAGAGGLHSRKGLQRKLWLWSEIKDLSLKKASPIAKDQAAGQSISFTAVHDGTKPGKPPAAGVSHALVTAFQDIYDSPAAEIAKQLNAWAQWGRVYGSPAPIVALTDIAPSQQLSSESSAVRFPRLASRRTGALRWPAMILFWVYPLLTLALVYLVPRADLAPALSLTLLAAAMLSVFGVLGILWLAVGGNFNYLEIAESGLVYRRLGRRTTYAWHELAQFDLHEASLRWNSETLPIILFSATHDDRISRYMRWAYRIDGIEPRIVIEDVYDIAASEILEVLERQLRIGGRVSRRASA